MKYNKVETFKYTTSKILPSVYDESLSYSELLAKVISYLNTTITNVDEFKKFLDDFIEKFDKKLKPLVIEFLQLMYDNGELKIIIDEFINEKSNVLDEKLEEFRVQLAQTTGEIDDTLKEFKKQLVQTNNRTQITPDDFEGSDIEKLQQVFDYAIENGIETVELTRSYDVTGGSIYFAKDSYYPFKLLTFRGGEIIKNDAGYVFDCMAENNTRNSPQFLGTNFTTKTEAETYLYNGDKMIRQSVTNSVFYRMGLVSTNNYLQTVRVINCETGELNADFIYGKTAYDFEMVFHRGESSTKNNKHIINIQTDKENDISFMSLRITDCLMEGFTRNSPVVLGSGYGLKINGLYCEANNTSIKFIKGVGADRLSGEISNSIFSRGLGDDGDVVFEGLKNFAYLKFNNITSNVRTPKTFTNVTSPRIKYENMNLYSGGAFSKGVSEKKIYTSYNVQQIDKLENGIEFEVKLNLKNQNLLSQQLNKQFLFNAKFVYGNTTWYSAHLTGIASIDGYYSKDKVTFGLTVDVLSERNTSGNTNGNKENTPVFDYYFKETGNKEALPTAKELTIVFKFEKGKYNASTDFNNLTFKPLNDIIADGIIDK